MVVATGGSFTLVLVFGRGEGPPAPTFSNASFGFRRAAAGALRRFQGEATGAGNGRGFYLRGSIGTGIAGPQGALGNGARGESLRIGAGGASYGHQISRNLAAVEVSWVKSCGM
jgi:hypothetical protein